MYAYFTFFIIESIYLLVLFLIVLNTYATSYRYKLLSMYRYVGIVDIVFSTIYLYTCERIYRPALIELLHGIQCISKYRYINNVVTMYRYFDSIPKVIFLRYQLDLTSNFQYPAIIVIYSSFYATYST